MPVQVISPLEKPTGHLGNLSSAGPEASPVDLIDLIPAASDPRWEGLVRVTYLSDASGTVSVKAFDDSGRGYEVIECTVAANRAVHFTSSDLEHGNANRELLQGVGPGAGTWRLELESDVDVEVLGYIRTRDGFLTSMREHVPSAVLRHRVSTFNPGKSTDQVSQWRLINPSDEPVDVAIRSLDRQGDSPGEAVRLTLPARATRTLTAEELDSGDRDGLAGAFGGGTDTWQLIVAPDRRVRVVSLSKSSVGHITNLSTRRDCQLRSKGWQAKTSLKPSSH